MPRKENFEYFSITIDFPKSNNDKALIKLYQDGKEIQETTCSREYLKYGDLFNNELCFTVGLVVSGKEDGTGGLAEYGKFDLYACRLYTKILTDTEINQNYIATTNYHNELVK